MENNFLEDEQLVELFKQSRQGIYFEVLFARYKQKVYLICFKHVRNHGLAEELTGEVFAKVYERIQDYERGNFSNWIMRMARNLAIGTLRRMRKEAQCLERIHYAETKEPVILNGKRYSKEDVSILFHQMLRKTELLKPEQRICFLLRYVQDYSYEEIAERTGYSLNEVKSHLQNALRNLSLIWQRL